MVEPRATRACAPTRHRGGDLRPLGGRPHAPRWRPALNRLGAEGTPLARRRLASAEIVVVVAGRGDEPGEEGSVVVGGGGVGRAVVAGLGGGGGGGAVRPRTAF